ncbi:MAG: zf-HC2 domain-containing protein [Cyclobacteriaceae bacterium]|nr:zf-HC2 domain-containing protein [Cyclobacteriaceae bacterium]
MSLKNDTDKPYMKQDALSHDDCVKMLYQVIDNEVCPEEKERFHEHLKMCMPCFKEYNLEKAIRNMIRSKCKKREVPNDLVSSIKGKISNSGAV